MTTKGLIDRVAAYFDTIDGSDADNTNYRARVLEWAQQVYEYVWNFRPWPFKTKTTTVTISSGSNSTDVPTDFQQLGPNGGLYYQNSDGTIGDKKLTEESPQTIQRLQAQAGSVAKPEVFAIYQSTDGRYKIQTPKVNANVTLVIWYDPVAPTLVDSDTSSKLESIPAGYHFTVLLAGVQEKAARDKGDARATTEWGINYRDGLKRMVSREYTQRSSPEQMPRAVMGMW